MIVTSRQTGFDAPGARLDIDVLTHTEGITLLNTRLPTIQDLAEQIVEELGRLPLAVEQAAAYLAETGTPAADYLNLLRTQGEALPDQ